MNVFPFNYTWQETILFYRFLRHRKGFGVHSPFAFSFITKVIDERCGYYCYQDIELIKVLFSPVDKTWDVVFKSAVKKTAQKKEEK